MICLFGCCGSANDNFNGETCSCMLSYRLPFDYDPLMSKISCSVVKASKLPEELSNFSLKH